MKTNEQFGCLQRAVWRKWGSGSPQRFDREKSKNSQTRHAKDGIMLKDLVKCTCL